MSNETEIKELENKIERFESLLNVELKELKEEVEELKQKGQEQEPWPRVGDDVTIVNLYGDCSPQIYSPTPFYEYQLETGNCHRTEKQALRHKEYITSPRVRARELVERCEGFNSNGEVTVFVAVSGDELQVTSAYNPCGGIAFESWNDANNRIIDSGNLIKVALGVIVGEEAERIVREYVGRGELLWCEV